MSDGMRYGHVDWGWPPDRPAFNSPSVAEATMAVAEETKRLRQAVEELVALLRDNFRENKS